MYIDLCSSSLCMSSSIQPNHRCRRCITFSRDDSREYEVKVVAGDAGWWSERDRERKVLIIQEKLLQNRIVELTTKDNRRLQLSYDDDNCSLLFNLVDSLLQLVVGWWYVVARLIHHHHQCTTDPVYTITSNSFSTFHCFLSVVLLFVSSIYPRYCRGYCTTVR